MQRMALLAAICALTSAPTVNSAAAPAVPVASAGPAVAAVAPALDVAAAERFANLALKCLHTEYPNHISHTMDGDRDARAPRDLTPAFYGCLDWHSDVHGHWLL